MKTTVSSRGQIVLPAELRRQDRIEEGQQFEVQRLGPGEYRLVRIAKLNEVSSTGCSHAPRRASSSPSRRSRRIRFELSPRASRAAVGLLRATPRRRDVVRAGARGDDLRVPRAGRRRRRGERVEEQVVAVLARGGFAGSAARTLRSRPCDGSFSASRRELERAGHQGARVDEACHLLMRRGAFCDCEVPNAFAT